MQSVTADDVVKELHSLKDMGAVEYVIEGKDEETEEVKEWVVGVDGDILKLTSVREVYLFVLGAQALAMRIARQRGLL